FFIIPPQPTPTLFPYTTLFRSHHDSHSATKGLQDAFQQSQRQRQGLDGFHHGGAIRGGFDCELPRREHAGHFCPQGKAAQCLGRSEEHTSELQSRGHLVCRLLL